MYMDIYIYVYNVIHTYVLYMYIYIYIYMYQAQGLAPMLNNAEYTTLQADDSEDMKSAKAACNRIEKEQYT